MPELTIVNTSPLFYLHRLGLLEVLNKLYGNIVVPEAVKTELEAGQIQGEDVPQLENYTWINVKSVNMPKYLNLCPITYAFCFLSSYARSTRTCTIPLTSGN